jgi:hypothetical protein
LAPEVDGFVGGISLKDNQTKQYVGYGGSCEDLFPVPGFINTRATYPGCFYSCGEEKFENKTSFYLLSHPNLTWIPSDVEKMMKIFDSVSVRTFGGWFNPQFLIGRVMYKGNYRVGNIVANYNKVQKFRMQDEGREISLERDFEVLSCSSDTGTACGKYISF